jgi:hypothetical protein
MSSQDPIPFKQRRGEALKKFKADLLEMETIEKARRDEQRKTMEACACKLVEPIVSEIARSPWEKGNVGIHYALEAEPLCKGLNTEETANILVEKILEKYGNEFSLKYAGTRLDESRTFMVQSHVLRWKLRPDN